MLYPKPKQKKQKKAKNNPRPGANDKCAICGRSNAHLHEVFYGKNRQNSIKYKMQIRLCYWCHEGDEKHKEGVHYNPVFDFMLKQKFQKKFEQEWSHEKFMQVFGKNYLGMTFEEYKKKGVDVA